MPVRGEEVAASIDAQVRESVERMVEEIRSSIEDVRVAVDQQLKAALQSVQADVKSITFLPQIRKSVVGLEEEFEAAKPAAPVGAGAASVKKAIQAIEQGKSQVDVLNALLEQCLAFGSRAALLILRGETFSGWKGVGFAAFGGSDENIKRFNAAPGLIPELDQLVRNERVIQWDGVNLATRLGMRTSERAIAVPMVIKDKISAAVYVDAIGDGVSSFDPDAIELLVYVTGLLVDTLSIRKKIPSPSLGESPAAAAPTAVPTLVSTPHPAAPAPPPAPAPAAAPPVRSAPPAPAVRPAETPSPTRTDPGSSSISPQQIRDMMGGARPGFNVPSADDFSAPAPRPPQPAEPARPAAAPAAAEERPSTQYIPPPGLARGGMGAGATDESRKHDEARRFARLLVSEIKLYNETKVDQGRKNNDIYERLKDDIDRSRQMYEERITEDVRKGSNYFYDELVRILADGRADALGL